MPFTTVASLPSRSLLSFPHDRVHVHVRVCVWCHPGAVEEGQFAYFTLRPGPATEDLRVTATALSGDVDLYLGASWDRRPRFEVRRPSLPPQPSPSPSFALRTDVLPLPRYLVLFPFICYQTVCDPACIAARHDPALCCVTRVASYVARR